MQLVQETGARNGRGPAQAFAHWLANLAGHPITGEPVDGDGPTFTAEPAGG